jgi:hypothetical protein
VIRAVLVVSAALLCGACEDQRAAASTPVAPVESGAPVVPTKGVVPPRNFARRQRRRSTEKKKATDAERARHAAAVAKRAARKVARGVGDAVDAAVETLSAPALPGPRKKRPKNRADYEFTSEEAASIVEPVVGPGFSPATERLPSLASVVEHELLAAGKDYDRELVRDFQRATRGGLVVDGVYGPATAGALQFYLRRPPPPHYLRTSVRVTPYAGGA